MRMSLAALIMVGSAAIAHAETCENRMTLEEAVRIHRSGEIDKHESSNCAVELVKKDIKACLTFYEPNECEGPAAAWVKEWDALGFQSASGKSPEPIQPLDLPQPSLLRLHVPFTKSAADYFVSMPSPSAGVSR